jgi:hypothetical protein
MLSYAQERKANDQVKCHPEHHIVLSRLKKVVARQAAAVPKSPEMLLDQRDNKIVSSLAQGAASSWLNYKSEEWEQFLADSFTPETQLPLPHFLTELKSEMEEIRHHPFRSMDVILESNSNAITGLDVDNGFGIEEESAMLPILTDFSSELGSQMVSNPS